MNKKIKICHICSYYENTLFDNLVKMQMAFTDPQVFFCKKKGTKKQYNMDYIDEIDCLSTLDSIFFFKKEAKVFKEFESHYNNTKFELNFAHSLFTNGYIAYLAKQVYGTPYIVMVQNTDMNSFYKLKPYLSKLALDIMINSSGIVFASESYKETLLSKHIPNNKKELIRSKCVIIPYGIEDVFYDDKPIIQFNQHRDTLRIICVGLICHNKNQLTLARAVDRLVREGCSIELLLIGKSSSKKLIKRLESYPFVKILSYMEKRELITKYKTADLFCLPSYTETFGLVYAEALSQGLPIIYSENQGFDKQFDEGYVGYRTNPYSIKSISKTIKLIWNNIDELKKNTLSAAEIFRWEEVTERYRRMYLNILGVNQ